MTMANESLVATRGDQPISDEDLCVHIASLLRLENVGVLLGAGASVCAEGLTMPEAWKHFEAEHEESTLWLKQQKFPLYSPSGDAQNSASPNIEHILDSVEIAIAEWSRTDNPLLNCAIVARANLYQSLVHASKLDEQLWCCSLGDKFENDSLDHHRNLLQCLVNTRQPGQPAPWIFTTNYDLAVEWSADSIDINVINGFIGSQRKKFSPHSFDLGFRNVRAYGEARFGSYNVYLAKLHGSLTWTRFGDDFFEIPPAAALRLFENYFSDPSQFDEIPFSVLASGSKHIQTVGYAYGEILRRYAEFVSQPQTFLLVSGYGFRDKHVNRLLSSALKNPTFHVIVFLPEYSGSMESDDIPIAIMECLKQKNPRITIVGGMPQSLFENLHVFLPDPAIYDETQAALRKRLNDRKREQEGVG